MPSSDSSKRTRQIADLIKREVAVVFKKYIRDPRLSNFTITDVDVAPDLSFAKVYYTMLDKSELKDAKIALEKIQGFVRHQLAKTTDLRHTPQIRFYYDPSVIEGEELSKLINKVVKD